jgi:hypothetical protein
MSGTDETTIGQIRQRTEEEELRQRLKSTVGGYSKSSVMEYLAEIRKQQQTSYETFNQNMQALLEEKENLKADNEKLLMQVAQAKAEFQKTAELKKQQTQVRQEPAAETSSISMAEARLTQCLKVRKRASLKRKMKPWR